MTDTNNDARGPIISEGSMEYVARRVREVSARTLGSTASPPIPGSETAPPHPSTGDEQVATPSPGQVRDGSGLARILAHIPDPQTRSYIATPHPSGGGQLTIYGQLAHAVGTAIEELEARIPQNPVAPVAPQQAGGPVPRITNPEAAAIVEMLETSLGVRFNAPRAVSDIMWVLSGMLVQLQEANQLLEEFRGRLYKALMSGGDLEPDAKALVSRVDNIKARATKTEDAPGATAPSPTGGCA